MGSIEFLTHRQTSRFEDPTQDFAPVEKVAEIRVDPLTGRTSHVVDTRPAEKPDVEAIVERFRRGFNPFVPDKREQVTPRFIEAVPEGRLAAGEALVTPNLFPYERHSAVTIVGEADYVPLTGFDEQLLMDAFVADLEYLRRVRDAEENLRHFSANWNYMPFSGGSVVHPHHQLIASPIPTNYLRDVEAGLARYGGDYFGDLLAAEEGGERWVGRGGVISWLTGFAPMGQVDVIGVFGGRRSIFDLTDEDVRDLVRALLRIFDYLDDEGFVSFNFSLYGLEGVENFTVHCRLSPRFLLANAIGTSDINFFEITHGEPLAFYSPEAAAERLREHFGENS